MSHKTQTGVSVRFSEHTLGVQRYWLQNTLASGYV